MGARILDWMKSNQGFCVGFVLGTIFGCVLGMIGTYFVKG